VYIDMADKKLSQEELMTAIEGMSVLELSDLVKALEEKFGVSAAATMVAQAPAGGAAAASDEPKEEQTIFNVHLASAGANKIAVIKAIRELVPTLGLKEAKDLVDGAPKEVMSQVNKKTADEAKEKLTAAGGTVELK
jgi:large subunit ribosomal protein L7/L12